MADPGDDADDAPEAALRDAFVEHLAHDLRNPLNTMVMSIGLLQRGDLTDGQKQTLDRLARAADRLTGMINEVGGLVRLLMGSAPPVRLQPCNMTDLVRDVVRELDAEQPGRVQLDAPDAVEVRCDVDGTRTVVRELLRNGLHHGAPDQPVTLSLRAPDGGIEVQVRNVGAIAPHLLPHLFDPVARATLPRARGHLGIGLYLAQAIARAHDGVLVVEGEDDRTTVTLRLPR